MKLPLKVRLESLANAYTDLDEWAGDNEETLSKLVLYGAEKINEQGLDQVILVEFTLEDETLFDLLLGAEAMEETLETNEKFWAKREEYALAARARDARKYIKKKDSLGDPVN